MTSRARTSVEAVAIHVERNVAKRLRQIVMRTTPAVNYALRQSYTSNERDRTPTLLLAATNDARHRPPGNWRAQEVGFVARFGWLPSVLERLIVDLSSDQ